jgi:pimeloyl-ACP methyl ester carboxylesterase
MNRQREATGTSLHGPELRKRVLADLPLTEHRRDLAGVSTAVLEGGTGAPIVLLHGQGEFAAVWTRVIPELVSTNRVVAPDLPGHGASECGAPPDAETVLAWLEALIDCTCDEPTMLVGHLLGGAIAARYAARRPGRLAHLVLVDTLGLARYRPAPRFALPMVRFIVRPTERSRDRMIDGCFVDMAGVGEQMGEQWDLLMAYALDRARTRSVQAAVRRLMPRLGVPAIPSIDLERIEVPTTLIHGRHDLQVRLRVAEAAAARYGWPLHVIEGARDDAAFEQPEAFLDALRAGLAHTDAR